MTLLTQEEKDKILIENQGLIYDIIIKIKRKKPWLNYVITDEDLVSAGNVGFLLCLKTFDKDLGFKISTYATKSIIYTIYKEIDKYQWPLRVPAPSCINPKLEKTKESIKKAKKYNKNGGTSLSIRGNHITVTHDQGYTKQEYENLLFKLRYRKKDIKFNGYVITEKKHKRKIKILEEYLNG